MTQHQTVSVQNVCYQLTDITLCGITLGNPDGDVILCLHGWLDNAASFLPLFEQLQCQQSALLDTHLFIAIDWPGHGLSDHRGNDAHYHFVDYVDDVYQLLSHLKVDNVSLLGHSMGGMVSSLFASAFAEKVKHLILIEALGLITETDSPGELLRRGIESRAKQNKQQKSIHKTIDSAVKARINVSDLDHTSAQLIVQRALSKTDHGYCWRSDARLRTVSLYRYALPQAQQLVSQITAPITVIKGDKGFAMIDQAISAFAHFLPRLTVHTLPGGHHVHMQQAKALLAIIENSVLDV